MSRCRRRFLLLFVTLVVILALTALCVAGVEWWLAHQARQAYLALSDSAVATLDSARARRCTFLEPGDHVIRRRPSPAF